MVELNLAVLTVRLLAGQATTGYDFLVRSMASRRDSIALLAAVAVPIRGGGGEVLAAGLHVIDGEVLHGGSELQMRGIVSLKTAHIGHGHAPGEIRIFAEDLLNASPARIAYEVDDG